MIWMADRNLRCLDICQYFSFIWKFPFRIQQDPKIHILQLLLWCWGLARISGNPESLWFAWRVNIWLRVCPCTALPLYHSPPTCSGFLSHSPYKSCTLPKVVWFDLWLSAAKMPWLHTSSMSRPIHRTAPVNVIFHLEMGGGVGGLGWGEGLLTHPTLKLKFKSNTFLAVCCTKKWPSGTASKIFLVFGQIDEVLKENCIRCAHYQHW